MNLIKDIQHAFKNANIAEKLIYANIAVFFIGLLSQRTVFSWFAVTSKASHLLTKPWTLITYAFIHNDLFHILSNLIVLFYIGNLFLNFYTTKQFKMVYLLGILAGAAFFIFGTKNSSFLIGSSAAVTAIFVAIATKIPHYSLRLRFIGSVELWVLAAIWIALSLLQVSANNGGGQLAHLGGAVVGFTIAFLLKKGYRLDKLFVIKDTKKNKSHLKTVYKSNKPFKQNITSTKQQQIDRILDKISKSGYESLSKTEKEFLFKAGK